MLLKFLNLSHNIGTCKDTVSTAQYPYYMQNINMYYLLHKLDFRKKHCTDIGCWYNFSMGSFFKKIRK